MHCVDKRRRMEDQHPMRTERPPPRYRRGEAIQGGATVCAVTRSEVLADGSQKLRSGQRRDDDPAQCPAWVGSVELAGELEGGGEPRALQVRERGRAPEPVRVREQADGGAAEAREV